MLNDKLNTLKIHTTPPAVIKLAISKAVSKRSTKLVSQAISGEITNQAFLAMQFPADAITYLEKHINEEIAAYEELRNEA